MKRIIDFFLPFFYISHKNDIKILLKYFVNKYLRINAQFDGDNAIASLCPI